MRVAIVHNFHAGDVPSGENEVVEAEAAALRSAGVDVELVTVHNDDMARRRLHSVQGAVTVTTGFGLSPNRKLARFSPDVIHVHSLFPYLGRRWMRDAPAPIVATLHSYRAVCANGYLFRDGEVCTLCPDGQRWAGVRHACYRDSRLATAPLAWAGRRGPAHDPLIRAAKALLVLSDRARAVMERAGAPADKMQRDWHFLPDDLGERDDGTRHASWLFVGRLSAEKGIARLVEEWPADVPLRVVGDGPLRSELEQRGAGRRIEFLGRRSRAEVLGLMGRSHGLVFPSLWYETFGLTYMEALAMGLPTLAFEPNVVADAVRRDGTGSIASWGSVAGAVAEAEHSFDAMRDLCRSVFVSRYTEAAFVERRMRLYESVLTSAH